MFRPCHLLLTACVFVGAVCQGGLAGEPHEAWLKALPGTWTSNLADRGKVTVTFKASAEGKCVTGTGSDKNGSFATIIGWEAWSKSLTDTGFNSSGGGVRLVYNVVTETTLKGVRKGAGPGGEPLPEAKVLVVRNGNTITITDTDADGNKTKGVFTKVAK